jgi:hypothetical protein
MEQLGLEQSSGNQPEKREAGYYIGIRQPCRKHEHHCKPSPLGPDEINKNRLKKS